jgi:hypothetical protein
VAATGTENSKALVERRPLELPMRSSQRPASPFVSDGFADLKEAFASEEED